MSEDFLKYDGRNEEPPYECPDSIAAVTAERDALQCEIDRAMEIGHVILAKLPKARRLFDESAKCVESLDEMMNMLMLVGAEPDEEEE